MGNLTGAPSLMLNSNQVRIYDKDKKEHDIIAFLFILTLVPVATEKSRKVNQSYIVITRFVV